MSDTLRKYERHVFNFTTKTCTCGRPQLLGDGCRHGCAYCAKYGVPTNSLVMRALTTEFALDAYTGAADACHLVSSVGLRNDGLKPPPWFKPRSRTKKLRVRSHGETGRKGGGKRVVKCGLCGHKGHTQRSGRCKHPPRAGVVLQAVLCARQRRAIRACVARAGVAGEDGSGVSENESVDEDDGRRAAEEALLSELDAFAAAASPDSFEFVGKTSRERAILHERADGLGLSHASHVDAVKGRVLAVSRVGAAPGPVAEGSGAGAAAAAAHAGGGESNPDGDLMG